MSNTQLVYSTDSHEHRSNFNDDEEMLPSYLMECSDGTVIIRPDLMGEDWGHHEEYEREPYTTY